MKLSADRLVADGACADQVAIVRAEWGSGDIEITAAVLERACVLGLDVSWLERYIPAPAWAEYERVRAPAQAEYGRVRAAAWAEYERVTAAAWAEYGRVTAAARAEYERVTAAAWAEYERVMALAWAEYTRVTAAALFVALDTTMCETGP